MGTTIELFQSRSQHNNWPSLLTSIESQASPGQPAPGRKEIKRGQTVACSWQPPLQPFLFFQLTALHGRAYFDKGKAFAQRVAP